MMYLVEWQSNGFSVLDQLAIAHLTHRSKDGESQSVLDFARSCETALEQFHCKRTAHSQRQSNKQRHHEGTISVGKALEARLSGQDDPDLARPERRLLIRDFGLLQKLFEQGFVHRGRSFQFTQSHGIVII